MVKLGKMMWKAMVKANCRRDSRVASKCILVALAAHPRIAANGSSRQQRINRLIDQTTNWCGACEIEARLDRNPRFASRIWSAR
jgi:hypothetical protein